MAAYSGDKALGWSPSEERALDELLDISSTRKLLWVAVLTKPSRHRAFILAERFRRHKTLGTHLYELTTAGVRHSAYESPQKLFSARIKYPTYEWVDMGVLKYRHNFEALLEQVAAGLPKGDGEFHTPAIEDHEGSTTGCDAVRQAGAKSDARPLRRKFLINKKSFQSHVMREVLKNIISMPLGWDSPGTPTRNRTSPACGSNQVSLMNNLGPLRQPGASDKS
ncbi:hypothetical protein QBC40DRAFT_320721 [Triangularia verruculosa]|uniref:Uncharacterized protein n=1 Tax=Triangularia verruculosa TaxID=2587418 RepID=A0AAN6XM42_9PEZI|nr:hypothetical protein QBC40DRAFT_320721 [Triangularia verruculosa]